MKKKSGDIISNNRKNTHQTHAVVLLLAGILLLAVAFFLPLWNSKSDSLFEERRQYLSTVVSSSAKIINERINTRKATADTVAHMLSSGRRDIADPFEAAAEIEEIFCSENVTVMLIDTNGKYYTSDGKNGRITALGNYTSDSPAQVVYISDEYGSNTDGANLCVRNRLDEPVTIGENTVEYCAVLTQFSEIEEIINRNSSIVFNSMLVEIESGNMIYFNYGAGQIYEGTNMYAKLRRGKLIHGENADDIIQQIKKGELVVTEFEREADGKKFFECHANIDDVSWSLCLTVPTSSLAGNNDYHIDIIRDVVGVSASVAALVIIIIVIIIKNMNTQREIALEKENSEILKKAAETAQSASKAKTEFLSHMSHDIRTPINGISGMTAIAKNNLGNKEKVNECLEKIDGASQHLLCLINDVLDMSRIESGKIKISEAPRYLETVLFNCSSIVEGQLIGRELDFKTDFRLEKKSLLVDELHLRQVIINILGNAIKFTPDGGRVSFTATETDSDESATCVKMEFEDTGIGMSEDFLNQIFEPFTQENDNGRSTYQGTGLGMAISKQLVELMGGTIKVESKIEAGTKFTVTVPFKNSDEKPQNTDNAISESSIEGVKILLVEDNELNREIALETLENLGAFVTVAENGLNALNCYKDNPEGSFDVILMDVMMPIMDGLSATKEIRASGKADADTIPIIALTANAFEEDIRRCLDAGMNSHIPKPFSLQNMISVISAYLRKGE